MSTKLRLVKVAVQPYFVLDDDATITEIGHPAVLIPASEWPAYSGERFPREVAEWQARLDAEAQEQPSALPPNRAVRRAKRPKS
jgi:hypothetical protein